MENELKDLQTEMVKIENQLSSTRQKIRDVLLAMYIRDTGINIGDEVLIDKTRHARITNLTCYIDKVVPIAQFYLQNGVLGKRCSKVYSYQTIKKYPSNNKIENKGE